MVSKGVTMKHCSPNETIDGFHFTMGIEGHYITMLLNDWSISTSHDPLPPVAIDAMESIYKISVHLYLYIKSTH